MRKIVKKLDGFDWMILLGFAAFCVGIGLLSVPAAVITAGLLLMTGGVIGAMAKGRKV